MTTPIDQKIVNMLLADATVTALVGTRIYPADLTPETNMPAIVVNITDEEPNENYLNSPSSLTNYHVDVMIYSLTYKVVRQIATACKAVLNFYSDTEVPRMVYKSGQSEPFENGKQWNQTYFAVHRD